MARYYGGLGVLNDSNTSVGALNKLLYMWDGHYASTSELVHLLDIHLQIIASDERSTERQVTTTLHKLQLSCLDNALLHITKVDDSYITCVRCRHAQELPMLNTM